MKSKNKTKHHTVLPTCSRKLRRQLRAPVHHLVIPVLSETVIPILVQVVIVVILINTDGSSGNSGVELE